MFCAPSLTNSNFVIHLVSRIDNRYRLYTGDHDGLIFVWNVSDGRGGLSGKKKKKTKKELAAIARANGESEVVEDTIYTVRRYSS